MTSLLGKQESQTRPAPAHAYLGAGSSWVIYVSDNSRATCLVTNNTMHLSTSKDAF